MEDQYNNIPNEIEANNTSNPEIGPMGRHVKSEADRDLQYRQAMIPDRTINVKIDTLKLYHKNRLEKLMI